MQPNEAAGVNAMAEALVASGTVSREAAARMLASDMAGEMPGEVTNSPAGDESTATGIATHADSMNEVALSGTAHDQSVDRLDDEASTGIAPRRLADASIDPMFAPPAAPEDYRFEMRPATGMQPAHLRAVREWCHTARLPQAIAQSLYSEVERGALRTTEPLTAAEIRTQNAAGLAELRRAWGERTGAMLGLSRRLVAEVGETHPQLIDFLDASGAESNPRVVRQLAEHAARIYGRPHDKEQRA